MSRVGPALIDIESVNVWLPLPESVIVVWYEPTKLMLGSSAPQAVKNAKAIANRCFIERSSVIALGTSELPMACTTDCKASEFALETGESASRGECGCQRAAARLAQLRGIRAGECARSSTAGFELAKAARSTTRHRRCNARWCHASTNRLSRAPNRVQSDADRRR